MSPFLIKWYNPLDTGTYECAEQGNQVHDWDENGKRVKNANFRNDALNKKLIQNSVLINTHP